MFSIDSRRPPYCRHVTKIPSPQLLLFPGLINCDARNPFRIRSYANCRVGDPLPPFWNSSHSLDHPYHRSFFSYTYEMQISQPLCFDIHTKCPGGVPPTPPWAKPLSVCMRLFPSPLRIPVRLSTSVSCLAPRRSCFFGIPAMSGPTLLFSTLISDEGETIARGLKRRAPHLLDRLSGQYQYRLFRYLVYITGNKARTEAFFQQLSIPPLNLAHQPPRN